MRNARGGLMIRLAIVLVLIALAAYEGGALAVSHVQADGLAGKAADAAALSLGRGESQDAARAEASTVARDGGGRLIGFRVSAGVVRVTIRKVAGTILIQHIGWFKNWRISDASQDSKVP